MIKRIKINNFRSLELNLLPLTVIFGPNASGKSNLLDAIHLLSRAVKTRNLNEAFKSHRGLPLESIHYTHDEGGYEGISRKTNLRFSFEVDVEISSPVIEKVERIIIEKRKGIDSKPKKQIITEKWLRYQLTIEILPTTGHLRVMDERLCAIKNNGVERKRNAFLEKRTDRLHLRMEGQTHPTFHEIGLDHTIISTALYEPHYPHITAFRMELENWFTYYLEPRELMREESPLTEIETIHPRNPATTIAFEEPENGVHPARIQIIGTLLKNASQNYGKQIIITTHSPILAQCFDKKDLFVCQKDNNQTSIKSLSLPGELFKKPLIDEGLADKILRGDFGG